MDKSKKRRLTIRGILSVLTVICMVRQFFQGEYQNFFLCIVALILFCVPTFIDRKMGVDIPPALEGIIYCFIFSAEILGEIRSFYTIFIGWDTILHTLNGFLMAAIGFALVDIFNRSEKFTFKLSPFFLAFMAFCFSMTVGVVWEFFEFGMDWFFQVDMQKDWIIHDIGSVMLNPQGLNEVVHVQIDSLVVNGEDWISKFGGYIDIGLIDTMKDLLVNFIGAVCFSIIGFFYCRSQGKGKMASQFIPSVKENEEEEKQ